MTDHAPSPATDGLREAIEALADEMEQAGVFSSTAWPSGWAAKVRALATHPAPLADPAPEAANIEDLIERSSLGTPEAKALRATVSDEDAARVVARSKELAADLPVATGVTTEDEAERDGDAWCDDGGYGSDADPAPAPVVSAGDEGEGLREDEREALEVVFLDYRRGRFVLPNPVYAAVERILAARVAEARAGG